MFCNITLLFNIFFVHTGGQWIRRFLKVFFNLLCLVLVHYEYNVKCLNLINELNKECLNALSDIWND